MFRKRKGQAALEFLTTYGWAFMVILVMIGALAYFGVLNPQNLVPDQCTVTSGFTCVDYQVLPATISVNVKNGMGTAITLSNLDMTINDVAACDSVTGADGTTVLSDGESRSLVCTTNAGATAQLVQGSKAKIAYEFDYTKTSGTYPHKVSGTITATVQ